MDHGLANKRMARMERNRSKNVAAIDVLKAVAKRTSKLEIYASVEATS